MRLISYESNGKQRSGVEVDGVARDTASTARAAGLASDGDDRWTSNRNLLSAGPEVLKRLEAAVRRLSGDTVGQLPGDARLGPPIADPDKIVCLGLNYRDHAEETGLPLPPAPMLFAKFRNSLAGPADDIVLPRVSERVDYEAELAVVIGRTCKDVTESEALDYVAGAMAFNDVTARDVQHQTSQWMAGKAIDSFAPCGPALVLAEELGDLQGLDIRTRVNGRTVQDSNTSRMIFSVAETVAFLSRLMTLSPGDIIATGTPAGVGFQRVPPVLLGDGDIVEVEIEGIGSLSNPVRSAPLPASNRPALTASASE